MGMRNADGVVKKTRVNLHIPKIVIVFFPIIVFVGFRVQYILESIHQEDLPSRVPSRRFASKAPSRRFAV